MNLNHLHIFHVVAEEGSISKGAARLCISQPAVSKQIAVFEGALHTPLFDRLSKGIALTEAGRVLHTYARRIFAIEQEAEAALQQLRGLETGRILIGASTSIGAYFLPDVLAAFHQKYPGVEIRMEIGNTETVQSQLEGGFVDVGFTEGFVHSPQLEVTVFQNDALVFIAAPDYAKRLLKEENGPLILERLCKEPFLVREAGSGTRAVVEEYLQKRGLSYRPAMVLGNTEAIKKATSAGAGVGVVSQITIKAEVKSGLLMVLPVADFALRRPLHQLQVRGRHTSYAVQAFLRVVRAASPSE